MTFHVSYQVAFARAPGSTMLQYFCCYELPVLLVIIFVFNNIDSLNILCLTVRVFHYHIDGL